MSNTADRNPGGMSSSPDPAPPEMRNQKRAVSDLEQIEEVINQSVICRMAVADDNTPYVIPMCFGYRDRTVYLHTGHRGHKVDVLRRNARVCLEFESPLKVKTAENPCRWGVSGTSVTVHGRAQLIADDTQAKREALDIIVQQYGGSVSGYSDEDLAATLIIKVPLTHVRGRRLV